MIKTILYIIGFLSTSTAMYSQASMYVLSVNNLKTRLNSNGLIADSLNAPAIQTANGLQLLDNAGVWMSATDSAGNIRVAAHSVLNNTHEFWAGPLELQNEKPSSQSSWNRVYPISKNEIQYHRMHYADNGYTVSSNILNWPGSVGSPYAQVMAPFVDFQINDQLYQPSKGDYPFIKSDALVYSISNDRYSSHTYSNGLPLGVELHTSIYGFANDSTLKNCVIVKYTVFNRSNRNYQNFRLSCVLNFGIGNLDNEYLGTEIGANTLYAINDTSEATFSGRLVSLGCMSLNRRLNSSMYFENTIDPINGRPDSAKHFFNLMQGNWKNGQNLNYGSNGVDGNGNAEYVYPDTTDSKNGGFRWIDQVPGKKIGIMNFDSIQLNRASSATYEFAYFLVEENYNNAKQYGYYCLRIKQALSDRNIVNLVENVYSKEGDFRVYPNPAKIGDKLYFDCDLETTIGIRLINMEGKEIYKFNLDSNDKSIILPPDLKPGVYVMEYKTLNTTLVQKLILN